jgi:DNA-binding MarR family transcriptional regulator
MSRSPRASGWESASPGFHDVRRHHDVVFESLDNRGLRITEMAARARITKQAMGELVTYLERHGYVARSPDPADGRAKLVRLTDRGRAVVGAAGTALSRLEARWAEHLGEETARALHASLADLCQEFGREHVR